MQTRNFPSAGKKKRKSLGLKEKRDQDRIKITKKKNQDKFRTADSTLRFLLSPQRDAIDYYAHRIPSRDGIEESSRNLVAPTGNREGREKETGPGRTQRAISYANERAYDDSSRRIPSPSVRSFLRAPPPTHTLPSPRPSLPRRSVFSMNSGRRTSCIAIFYFRNASSFFGNGS